MLVMVFYNKMRECLEVWEGKYLVIHDDYYTFHGEGNTMPHLNKIAYDLLSVQAQA